VTNGLVLHGQGHKVWFAPADRALLAALLAALLHRLPRDVVHRVRLLVPPETVLRWHRDLIASPHARISGPKRVGRPRTVRSIRLLVLRRSRENSTWGYRRIHGELLVLGIRIAASTVWEILNEAGIDPAPERSSQTWAALLRSQAEAIHTTRPVRVLGATAHPRAARGYSGRAQPRHGPEGHRAPGPFLIRDRDGKYPAPADTILTDTGIHVVLSGVRMPRTNAIMKRWIQTCRRELLDRTLVWNQAHLLHALRQYERHDNEHQPHRGISNSRPLQPLPEPITDTNKITHLAARRRDRLGGIQHEHEHALYRDGRRVQGRALGLVEVGPVHGVAQAGELAVDRMTVLRLASHPRHLLQHRQQPGHQLRVAGVVQRLTHHELEQPGELRPSQQDPRLAHVVTQHIWAELTVRGLTDQRTGVADGVDGRRRVVHGRRQSLDGDVRELAQAKGDVLGCGAIEASPYRTGNTLPQGPQDLLVERLPAPGPYGGDGSTSNDGVAWETVHGYHRVGAFGGIHE
jgi:hypothetical protein